MTVWEGLVTSVPKEAQWLPNHCLEGPREWLKVRVEEVCVTFHLGWAGWAIGGLLSQMGYSGGVLVS